MERPAVKNLSPESYSVLKEYAEYLSTQLDLKGSKLKGDELTRLKWEARYAWREVGQMAVAVSQSFAKHANAALEQVLHIDKETE